MLKVNLETNRLAFNQEGSLIAISDSEMNISVLCFTQPPRPPKLSPCDECGKFQIISGERFYFNPSPILFENKVGHLKLIIKNLSGDIWEHRIDIERPRPLKA